MASSLKPTRLAGLLYLIVVVAGVFTLKIVPDQIIVPGDAAATADHLRASETLFRFAMLIDLLAEVLFLIVVIAVYRLLRDVHEGLSTLLLVFASQGGRDPEMQRPRKLARDVGSRGVGGRDPNEAPDPSNIVAALRAWR